MTRLDPDELAELEREQTFLLRSLDDLDTEHQAGDLGDHDHSQLDDDYTRRLAEVTRAIEENRAVLAQADTGLSRSQRALTIVAVALLALIAGVVLARASGFRSPVDTLSGDIRRSSAGLLAEADTLTREGEWARAINVYDDVLEIAPANVEALTYKGWLTSRLGDPEAAIDSIAEAVAVDPTYPDARVFRAILLDDEQRFDEAAADLAVLDTLGAPAQILSLVDSFGLRASVAAGQIGERFAEPGTPVDLDQISSPVDAVAAAGVALLDIDIELALRTFDGVLEADPTNLTALVASGQVKTNPDVIAASPETGAAGLALLDRAVRAAPDNDQVRLFRALARDQLGDAAGAADDLELIDRASLPVEAVNPFDQLADALASGS